MSRLQKPLLGRSAVSVAIMTIVGIALAATANKIGAQMTRLAPTSKPTVCLAAGATLNLDLTCPSPGQASGCRVSAELTDSTGGRTSKELTIEETVAETTSPTGATKAAEANRITVVLEMGDDSKKGGCACGLMQLAIRPPGPGPKGLIQVRPPGPKPK
jgi:hypothetical protein